MDGWVNGFYFIPRNSTLSCNAETIDFARLTSHPVRGWTGKNKIFCSPGTQNGRRVIKVYANNQLRYSSKCVSTVKFHKLLWGVLINT